MLCSNCGELTAIYKNPDEDMVCEVCLENHDLITDQIDGFSLTNESPDLGDHCLKRWGIQ